MRPALVAIALLLGTATTALAGERLRLPNGVTLTIDGDSPNTTVYARRAKEKIVLADKRDFDSLRLAPDKQSIVAGYTIWFSAGSRSGERRFTLPEIDAAFELDAARVAKRRKQLPVAEAALARALALTPSTALAADLAAVRLALGNRDGAVAALQPFVERELPALRERLLSDAALAPLTDEPRLLPPSTITPGTSQLRDDGALTPGPFAVSGDWLAVERSSTADGSGFTHSDLVVYSLSRGTPIARFPLFAQEREEDVAKTVKRAPVKRRLALLNRLLRELGFGPPPPDLEEARRGPDRDDGSSKLKLHFDKAKLGIVYRAGTVRLLRGDEVLAERKLTLHGASAVWWPEKRMAIVEWSVEGDYHHGVDSDAGVLFLKAP